MKSMLATQANLAYSLGDFYRQAGLPDPDAMFDNIPVVLPDDARPSPFQVESLNRILTNPYWGFLHEAGTGKTTPAQAYSIFMATHGYRSLLVMPPVLRQQYVTSLNRTYPGVDQLLNWHILDEPPYPARLSKKRVQEIKRQLWVGEIKPKDLPQRIFKIVDGLKKAVAIQFTQKEIQALRADPRHPEEIAKDYMCSVHGVKQLKSKTFREDLIADWKANDTWPDLLLMSYQMYVKTVTDLEPGYTCLMADEAHALCHPTSMAYKKTNWFLHKDDKTFLPMTGTPAPNVPSDTYGLIKLLNENSYQNFASFKALHVDSYQVEDKEGNKFAVVNGYMNLDTMSRALYAKACRVTKDQVLKLDQPRIIEEDVQLSPQHLKLYRKLLRERVLTTKEQTIVATEAQALRQKALQIVLNPDVFTDEVIKENAIKDWLIEKLDSIGCEHHEKVVVFAHFNQSVEKLAQWFKHLNPALVYGGSKTEKNVQKFLTDETCRLMIAHPKSGGVGVDQLQTVCHYVIFVEPTSVPGDFSQALDRLVRRGQMHPVVCYVLRVMKTSWPARVNDMRRKMKLISDVTLDRTALLDELLGN